MSSMTRLRVQICATCCVLGGATAFLAFTNRGMLVLAIAIGVAAVLAVLLWFSRPDLFRSTAPDRPVDEAGARSLRCVATSNAEGYTSRSGGPEDQPDSQRTSTR